MVSSNRNKPVITHINWNSAFNPVDYGCCNNNSHLQKAVYSNLFWIDLVKQLFSLDEQFSCK